MIYERAFVEGSLDVFEYALAEKLRMTVGEMRVRMSNQEYVQWRAFWKYRDAMNELASKEQ